MLGACRRGDVELVNMKLKQDSQWYRKMLGFRSSLNEKDKDDNGPVHIASQYGQQQIIALLMQSGVSLQSKNARTGATPLHMTAIHGHLEIARLCIRNGAKLDEPD